MPVIVRNEVENEIVIIIRESIKHFEKMEKCLKVAFSQKYSS